MANYSANVAVTEALAANTVDYVSLTNPNSNTINVVNETGTAVIYVTYASGTAHPTAPTVGGNDCIPVPAEIGSIKIPVATGPIVVGIISASIQTYSIVALI